MYYPNYATFQTLSAKGNLIPVYREILADLDTPVGAFKKIDDGRYGFLLESIEGGEKWGRYTFLGSSPAVVIRGKGSWVEIVEEGLVKRVEVADPLNYIRDYMARYLPVEVPGIPRFFGGAVGYLGYDAVRHFETLPDKNRCDIDAYDA
jgi:anthranilate synthase component I